ncbi:MAG: hypothetical protein Q9187_006844, partial [Circinaria calcarea]
CRLPGGASSTSRLWDLLTSGRSGQCEIPDSRFNVEGFFHQNADHPGSVNGTGGYFIQDDIRLFENTFFGINNLEAKYMDPQQRQLLEVVFECFESAGATLANISDSATGCYVANFTTDYVTMQAKDPDSYHRYSATGFGPTILANRISHVFNLKGPSVVLDTACSSSLYALHVACMALNAGECDAAIVAGANLIQSPEMHLAMVKAGVLSGTSTSHTFDASADGYGRGEGVGALYLKRLRSAIKDRDPIRSVDETTITPGLTLACHNSNGHTPGITFPSVAGQEAVIQKAYAMAGLATDETTYIEAHGTGTPLGDPTEIEALSRVLRLKSGRPTLIGSVKTNLGHSEAVSGISSVIKVSLALENGLLPATIGIKNINPELKVAERNIEVVTELRPWPEGTLARASVNSFGYGGANAHVIIESAKYHVPKDYDIVPTGEPHHTFILPFSAYSSPSLMNNMKAISSSGFAQTNLSDLAFTLGCRRSCLPVRGYLLANGHSLDIDLLPSNFRTPESVASSRPFAFVFTGQGAQWPTMGRELLDRFWIYRKTIRDLDSCLARLPHPPSWNLEGEIAAAFAAGHLTADEAITIAYYRGLTVSEVCRNGSMLATGLDHKMAAVMISDLALQDKACVACVNSPESTTISGDSEAIEELLPILQERGIFARKLKTDDKAYHSHHMKFVGQRYEDLLSLVCSTKPSNYTNFKSTSDHPDNKDIHMFSSVSGNPIGKDIVTSTGYWRANLELPVLFSDALEKLLRSDLYHIIEIGPHPALGQPIREIQKRLQLHEDRINYSSTLSRGKNAETSMLDLAGKLWSCGNTVLFDKINNQSSVRSTSTTPTIAGQVLHSLPSYNWHYDAPLWNESRVSSDFRKRKYKHHDLLGSRVPGSPGKSALWRNLLKVKRVSWLQDHKLGQTTVFPGAGYLAMAIEGLYQVEELDHSAPLSITLHQVHLSNILILPDDSNGIEVFLQIEPVKISSITSSILWWRFEITSNFAGTATTHANGLIAVDRILTGIKQELYIDEDTMQKQSTRTWYDKLAKEGLYFGPAFRSMSEIHTHRGKTVSCAISKTFLQRGGGLGHDQQSEYAIHPITIDSLLQTAIIASASGTVSNLQGNVPVSIDRLVIVTQTFPDVANLCTVRATSKKVGFGTVMLKAELEDTKGHILAKIDGVRAISYMETLPPSNTNAERNPALRIFWKPDISMFSMNRIQGLTSYIERFASLLSKKFVNSEVGCFAAALDLITHQNPRLQILELDIDGKGQLGDLLDQVGIGLSPRRFESYTKAVMMEDGGLLGYKFPTNAKLAIKALEPSRIKQGFTFDAVIIPPVSFISPVLESHIAKNIYRRQARASFQI